MQMSSPLQVTHIQPDPAGNNSSSNRPSKAGFYSVKWSMVIEEAKALFSRLAGASTPLQVASAPASAQTGRTGDERVGTFIAKENFKRGNDLVYFGDELYKWRDEFNLRPTFIALRNIESGEEVISDPTDLERSDLMIHWGLTYRVD
jgi:hypothetical protein